MALHIEKPIVFFDIESTGLNIIRDRIVEICLLKVWPDGKEEVMVHRLNPMVPISAESSQIHGITEDMILDKPTFKEVSKEIYDFIGDSDIAGFNSMKFDLPMIQEEFLRSDMDFDLKARNLIDVQMIFHKMEERTLSAAYRFYCNRELENAHNAEADTRATYEVFKAQVERYEPLKTDMKTISEFIGLHLRLDLEGRIIWNDQGQEIFNFGKHKGRTVEEVFQREPNYYKWMMEGEFLASTKKIITDIRMRMLKNKFENKP